MTRSQTTNRWGDFSPRAILFCLLALSLIVLPLGPIRAQGIAGVPEDFQVAINKSRVIKMHKTIKKVSMGNPLVADIIILKGSQIYILGKRLGTTNVQLWDNNNELVKVLDIEVTHDLYQIKKKLHLLLPNEDIEVYSAQKSVILKGQVSSLVNMDKAVRIAKSFAMAAEVSGEKSDKPKKTKEKSELVINLLSVGGSQQVMLKVTVAELERTTIRKLGIKWYSSDLSGSDWRFGGVSGGGSFPDADFNNSGRVPVSFAPPIIGPVIDEFLPNDLSIADKGIFAQFLNDDLVFAMALDAAKDNGTAKILAEPTITALSGEKAKFLSGGEFPIPVPDRDGITIKFKEFGIAVEFVPVVLSNGNINLKLAVSVSELTAPSNISIGAAGNTASTFFVPALTVRSASTTVELADGQSIGLAGLISENTRGVVNKFPGLGDIPILGHLFRSEEFEKGETELVIMVTPMLAQAMDKPLTHLPTDSYVEPNDIDFYLMGRIHGRRGAEKSSTASDHSSVIGNQAVDTRLSSHSGGVDGEFGHSVE